MPPSSVAWRRSTSPTATSTCRSRRSASGRPKRSATGSQRCRARSGPRSSSARRTCARARPADRVLAALQAPADAAPVADDDVPGVIAWLRDERLREKEFGILDRLTPLGIRAKYPDLAEQRLHVGKFYFRPPGGESWCDVILRLRSFLDMLTREYRGDRVLVVAHQVIVNCLRYLLERTRRGADPRHRPPRRRSQLRHHLVRLRPARRSARQARPAARELRLAAARSRRAGDRRARRAGGAEIVMATEIGATVDIDARLLRALAAAAARRRRRQGRARLDPGVAGSAEMPGAAVLAATAALRAGAGKLAGRDRRERLALGTAARARGSARHRAARNRGRRAGRRRPWPSSRRCSRGSTRCSSAPACSTPRRRARSRAASSSGRRAAASSSTRWRWTSSSMCAASSGRRC